MNLDWGNLLPGLSTALIAFLSGAGGSALLELYYKPRRDRQRAASLLFAENILNAQLLLLQAEARKKKPRAIPEDFRMSLLAWEASQDVVKELPTDLLKKIVLLYNHYHSINNNVSHYAKLVRELEGLDEDSERAEELREELNVVVHVFNTGLDEAFELCEELLGELKDVGDIEEREEESESPADYESRIEQLMEERAVALQALREMDQARKEEGADIEE